MEVVSLFAGCGGLDLGFEQAGFDVVWANEFDTSIHDTYRLNHPHTKLNTSDIRKLSPQDIPDCDGIIGGPPCQSWSLGGKCLGIDDERGKLINDYIRIVNEKKPKFFIMENVPGMTTPRHIKSFKQFLSLFEAAGYRVKYELINAADFKIPQERLRLIIVGIRKDLKVEYFFPTQVSTKRITLRQAIGDLSTPPRPYYKEKVEPCEKNILNNDYYTGPFDQKYMARNRVRNWDELSFTIQAQARNEPLHPQAPKMVYVSVDKRIFVPNFEHLYRRLSVRECARIQTFPDKFKFLYSDIEDGYKMVGNAVPPRLAYYLALSIRRCFEAFSSLEQKEILILVGYVKSEADFETIKREKVYYIRGGNRVGAMQYGQVIKPIKLLLLHKKNKKELYKLTQEKPFACNSDYLKSLGFKPKGNEYWAFQLGGEIKDEHVILSIYSQVQTFSMFPQIVVLNV